MVREDILKHAKVPKGLFGGKKVLDIGCGRKKLSGAVGLDQCSFPGVDIVSDLNRPLPLENASFDAVHANQVLEHVNNVVDLVYEAYRVLRPGGIFLLHCPYFRSSWAHLDPTHIRCFTINSMDYFVKGTFCYEQYRFRDEAFQKVDVFLDNDYPSTFSRAVLTQMALKNPFQFENSFLSGMYIFQQVTYLLTK